MNINVNQLIYQYLVKKNMKKYIIFVLAMTLLGSCNRKQEKIQTFDEMVNAVTTIVDDTTVSIDQLDNVLPMLLDSLEEGVNSSPEANDRYEIRLFASILVDRIKQVRTSTEYLSFITKYNEQLQKIIYSWYVQQTDTLEDKFYMLSHAAPIDMHDQIIRCGFVFAESKKAEPTMIITLPNDAINRAPSVLFVSQIDGQTIYSDTYVEYNNNLKVFADNQLVILLDGEDFMRDILSYQKICVAYYIPKISETNNPEQNSQDKECMNSIVVSLSEFQKSYQQCHQWLNK